MVKVKEASNLGRLQLYNACMSYRHDYGLLSYEEKQKLAKEAKEWFKCFGWDYKIILRDTSLEPNAKDTNNHKIKPLEWLNVTEDYDGLEVHKASNTLGWYAVYLDDNEYVAVHEKNEMDLFTFHARKIATSSTLEQAKQAAQEYHNKLVLSLLED